MGAEAWIGHDGSVVFEHQRLSYSDVNQNDIKRLIRLMNLYLLSHRQSQSILQAFYVPLYYNWDETDDGNMQFAAVYITGDYFVNRPCVYFNKDGFIELAGWADSQNLLPIQQAFVEWCSGVAFEKQIRERIYGCKKS